MKKFLAMLLIAALALTMFSIPAMAETTTIKVMLWDRGDAPTGGTVENSKMTTWINEQIAPLGIQVEFVSTPRSGSDDKLVTWMAGGSAPDIIFSYGQSTFLNFATQGGLVDLGPAIEKLGDDNNIVKYVGDVMNMGNIDGHQFALLSKRGAANPRHTAYIRADWLEELNLPMPTTYTELADTLVAFSQSGEGRYGYIAASSLQFDLNNLLMPFGVQVSRAGNMMGMDAEGKPVFVPMTENYKAAVAWACDLFERGALDPEYFTQTSDMVRAKVQDTEAGPRTGIVFAWTADSELLGNAKDYVVVEAVAGPDGNRYVESDPTFLNYGKNEFVITKNCSDPGKLLTWADQFYTDEASLQTYYGSIGDGKIAKNEDGTYEVLLPAADSGINLDTSCWTFSFRDHGPKYMNEEFESKVILPTTEGDGIKLADDAVNAKYARDTFPVVAYTAQELDDMAFLSPDITSYCNQQYAHWVTEGGVEEEWDAYIAKLNQMNVNDLIQIHLDAYARYMGE